MFFRTSDSFPLASIALRVPDLPCHRRPGNRFLAPFLACAAAEAAAASEEPPSTAPRASQAWGSPFPGGVPIVADTTGGRQEQRK